MSVIFDVPTKVFCEAHISPLLSDLLVSFGKRILIVVDPYLYSKLENILPDLFSNTELFLHIEKSPPCEPETSYIDNLTLRLGLSHSKNQEILGNF